MTTPMDRRSFLAGIGVLGALAATSTAPETARAAPAPSLPLVDTVAKLLGTLSKDVYRGLAVFVLPGQDAHSRSQGSETTGPGALDARTHEFLIESLDNYVPFPQQIAVPLARALSVGLDDVPIKLPLDLPLPDLPLDDVEAAVRFLLRNDETLPLSTVIALLLNTLAVRVDPTSAIGPFLSPFSRLSFEKKAQVFELLEGPDAQLVALIDGQLPEPLRGSVSGLLQFVAGALLEFSAFGAFSEWSTFDPATLGVTERPVGWELAQYDPGSMEGWNEFKGYYQGRQKVSKR